MIRILLGIIICFALTAAVFPLGIKLISKLKAQQEILHYVESHAGKSGTPTMGGIIFIITIAGVAFSLFYGEIMLAAISVAVMLGYGIIGFLDDFLKVHYKQNLGLKAYQKIIFQLTIAVVIAIFAYFSPYVGTSILIPFTTIYIDIGWGAIPLIIIVFLACTNCVNLTDGLDGLAGSVTAVYLVSFIGIILVLLSAGSFTSDHASEMTNILILAGTAVGGLLGFLCFNSHPARVFMGDTGSLALGGMVAITAIFTRMELIIPIIGIMFVLSGISVIIQVLHYKRTKKRVFLMAPLHHHFEKKGVHEAKIVTVYVIATIIAGALSLLIYLIAAGIL